VKKEKDDFLAAQGFAAANCLIRDSGGHKNILPQKILAGSCKISGLADNGRGLI